MLTDGRRTTDDGRKVMAIAHMTIWVYLGDNRVVFYYLTASIE